MKSSVNAGLIVMLILHVIAIVVILITVPVTLVMSKSTPVTTTTYASSCSKSHENKCVTDDFITIEKVSRVKYYDVPLDHDLQDYIFKLSDEYKVPTQLIMAVIEVESSFRSNVVSRTNDYGLICKLKREV